MPNLISDQSGKRCEADDLPGILRQQRGEEQAAAIDYGQDEMAEGYVIMRFNFAVVLD